MEMGTQGFPTEYQANAYGELPGDSVQPELEGFRVRYPMDEAAWAYLLKSGPDVQREVLKDFKPKEEGQADYSALVISFCKRRRQQLQQGIMPPPAPSPEVVQDVSDVGDGRMREVFWVMR
ncbi:Uncharacterized protein SCF082_LOCUS4758 [Durusdinium trenchii]|uniref:Uncharacterized protein n=1 Tax=Durusdinium trenchii TaxID=1381693 RepID=A0ABP0I1C8_9DINO